MGREGASTQRLLQLHGCLPVPICTREDCVRMFGECVKGNRVGKRTGMRWGRWDFLTRTCMAAFLERASAYTQRLNS